MTDETGRSGIRLIRINEENHRKLYDIKKRLVTWKVGQEKTNFNDAISFLLDFYEKKRGC